MEYLANMAHCNDCYHSYIDQEVYGHHVYMDRLIDSFLVMHEVEAAVNDTLEIDEAGRNNDKLVSDQNDCATDKLIVDECDIGHCEIVIGDAECEYDKLVINAGEVTEFCKLIIDEDYSKSDGILSDDDSITSNDRLVIDDIDTAADASTLAEIAHSNKLVILDHDYAILAACGLKARSIFTGTYIDNQSKACSCDNFDESLGQKANKNTLRSSTEQEETERDDYRNNVHADHNYPSVIKYIEQSECCDELHVKHNKETSLGNPNSFLNKSYECKRLHPTDIDVTYSGLEGYRDRTRSEERQIIRKSEHDFNDIDNIKRSVHSALCQLESNNSHRFNLPLVPYCRDNHDNSVPESHNQLYHEGSPVLLNTTSTQNINSLNHIMKTNVNNLQMVNLIKSERNSDTAENESNNGTNSNNAKTLHHLTSDQDADLHVLEDCQGKFIKTFCKSVSCDKHDACALKLDPHDVGSHNGLQNNELLSCTKPGANEVYAYIYNALCIYVRHGSGNVTTGKNCL